MKLIKLRLNADFCSLSDGFELDFRTLNIDRPEELEEFNPFCFAGVNGSGKSNVLEAIANIFYHLEGCINIYQPDNFKSVFNPKIASVDAYELEYLIFPKGKKKYSFEDMILVHVEKKIDDVPVMTYSEYPYIEKLEDKRVVSDEFDTEPASAKTLLPDLIIGYTSGENEVLSIPFIKTRLLHFDEYKEAVIEDIKYTKPESNLLYIDYEMSQSVLLSNLLFQSKETLKPITSELGIKNIKSFRMNINLHQIHSEDKSFPLLEQINEVIEFFKNCATCYFENEERLTLDFWINSESKKAFETFFGDAFTLFQSFQILYTLNYRTVSSEIKKEVYQSKGYYTNGKIPEPELKEKVFYFLDYYIEIEKETGDTLNLLMRNLSDGEQQFLHTLGICLMLKDKNCLLLFDEPETHFNPDWRAKFISILQESLKKSECNNLMKDILITSHSPFLISDCYPNKVIVFGRNDEDKVTAVNASDKNIRTFGSSYDIIMEDIFNKNQSIGNYANSKFQKIKFDRIKNVKDIKNIKKDLRELGDSYEKDMIFSKLNRIEKELKDASNI